MYVFIYYFALFGSVNTVTLKLVYLYIISPSLAQIIVLKLLVLTNFSTGLSGDVVMNYIGDRQPTFFVYDLNSDGQFHQVASLYYRIDGDLVRVVSVTLL